MRQVVLRGAEKLLPASEKMLHSADTGLHHFCNPLIERPFQTFPAG
jgi:hypothetical protein